ncbi:MAG: aldo/keto reductase, partial [Mariniblastus sp.]
MSEAKFGLGLAALGRPGYINIGHGVDLDNNYAIRAMEQRAHAVLDTAWELGVRYFDAARSYGRAEEFLSNWIQQRDINPSDVRIGSKWGYTYTAAWRVQTPDGVAHEIKRHELKVLQSQYMASYQKLGDHLDLYQIHSATLESGVLDNEEVLL